MFDTFTPSKAVLSLDEFKDKVLGCWTGKNIGGTLGAPFEGKREMNDATFYVQDLKGDPAPNDDLDLQLLWMVAAERHGLYNITPRLLGEYWYNYIVGPWNEYSVCKANVANGLFPPLSGSCNNDRWKFSNGAWIRSEIWACLFPGSPDEAAQFAYYDSCCDHTGEGVYAELFTASMEAAAFVVSDLRKIIEIGLSKIPGDCRVARAAKLACSLYDKKTAFKKAREAIVKDSEDLGWFQAPGNIGFTILGLLYGEGDFGRTISLANNCGDDTDCTAATAGAIFGIIKGRSGIPKKWLDPIGESIKTVAIDPFSLDIPQSLGELTDRVVNLALLNQHENPALPRIAKGKSSGFDKDFVENLSGSAAVEKRIWARSPYELSFDLPFGELTVDYENGPYVETDKPLKLTFRLRDIKFIEAVMKLSLDLPEGWRAEPGPSLSLNCVRCSITKGEMTIVPGKLDSAFSYIPLQATLAGRLNPFVVMVPFQMKGAANHVATEGGAAQENWDSINRMKARRAVKN